MWILGTGFMVLNTDQKLIVERLLEKTNLPKFTIINRLRNFNWDEDLAEHGTNKLCPDCNVLLYKGEMLVMDADEFWCKRCGKKYTVYWQDEKQQLRSVF